MDGALSLSHTHRQTNTDHGPHRHTDARSHSGHTNASSHSDEHTNTHARRDFRTPGTGT